MIMRISAHTGRRTPEISVAKMECRLKISFIRLHLMAFDGICCWPLVIHLHSLVSWYQFNWRQFWRRARISYSRDRITNIRLVWLVLFFDRFAKSVFIIYTSMHAIFYVSCFFFCVAVVCYIHLWCHVLPGGQNQWSTTLRYFFVGKIITTGQTHCIDVYAF